jgi:hypothetical protein
VRCEPRGVDWGRNMMLLEEYQLLGILNPLEGCLLNEVI